MQRWWSAAWDAERLRRHNLALRDCSATFPLSFGAHHQYTDRRPGGPGKMGGMRQCCLLVATVCNSSFGAQGNRDLSSLMGPKGLLPSKPHLVECWNKVSNLGRCCSN